MSDAGDMITAITTDIETAVSGVTVGLEPLTFDEIVTVDLPYCVLLLTDYSVEYLDWGQEQRTWTFGGWLVVKGGTREAMQVLLDSVRDEVFSDPTLGGYAERASCATIVPYSSRDSERVYGEFSIQAEKVV